MKKILILLISVIISNCIYCIDYTEQDYNPSISSFKSTSPISVHYYTVRPLNQDGTVSSDYTTSKYMSSPKRVNGLELDDDDEPNASKVPVGDIPLELMILLIIIFIIVKQHKI